MHRYVKWPNFDLIGHYLDFNDFKQIGSEETSRQTFYNVQNVAYEPAPRARRYVVETSQREQDGRIKIIHGIRSGQSKKWRRDNVKIAPTGQWQPATHLYFVKNILAVYSLACMTKESLRQHWQLEWLLGSVPMQAPVHLPSIELPGMQRRFPNKVLLVGHPGEHRTMLAKAIAGEAVVPLVYVSISSLVEILRDISQGTRTLEDFELPVREYNLFTRGDTTEQCWQSFIRHFFSQTKKNAPCLLMLDDLDALQPKENEEDQRLMNFLLAEVDGFNMHQRVAVIAAACQLDKLDEATFRAGRFAQRVVVRRSKEAVSPEAVRSMALEIEEPLLLKPTCPACKREVSPRWKHCVYCAASLEKACPRCGAPRAQVEGARFCFECGTPLE